MTDADEVPPVRPGDRWGKATRDAAERRLLQGPRPRGVELVEAVRIFAECLKGFRRLHFVGPCVTVFGSARFKDDHPYYVLARELGAGLARAGFTVMTGGGPGIMEAANRGAKEGGGYSVGGTIDAPDAARWIVTDSPEEAVATIRERAMKQFGLTYGPRAKARWWLGEW